jgi:hypothetical protein
MVLSADLLLYGGQTLKVCVPDIRPDLQVD